MLEMTQTIPFSAVKLLITACRRYVRVAGSPDELYPDEWAIKCEPNESIDILVHLGLIAYFSKNRYVPTRKGVNLYVGHAR